MRTLLLVLLLGLPACDRWETPWVNVGDHDLTEPWSRMGLPLGDGAVQRSDAQVLVVEHPARTQSERLAHGRAWESALTGQGWRPQERHGDLVGTGHQRVGYVTADGGRVMLEYRSGSRGLRVMVRRF